MRRHARSVATAAAAVLLAARSAGATVADDLCGSADDPCVVSTPVVVEHDSNLDFGARTFRLADGASLRWSSSLTIVAGIVDFQAGSTVTEVAAVPTQGFLEIRCRASTLAGTVTNVGAALWIHDDDFGGGAHVVSGTLKVKNGQESLIAIDTIDGDITVSGRVSAKAKGPTPVPGEFRLVTNFGNVLITDTARIKLARAVADPFSELVHVEAGMGSLTVNGQLDASATDGAYSVNLEANGDVAFGPASKVKTVAKLGHAIVGINSEAGGVTLGGKILAGTKDAIAGPDGIGICASQDIVMAPKARVDARSKLDGGTIVLGAGGTVQVGSALGGAKVLAAVTAADIEICGNGGGVTVAPKSRVVPSPAALGSGVCISPSTAAYLFLDCIQ